MSTIGYMGILLTNGDSFTFGDELPGSRNVKNFQIAPCTHHELTWAKKLADKLDVPLTNLAHNGSSNQKILRRTTTFLQQTSKKIDYMVLIWSSWGRVEVVGEGLTEADRDMYIHQEMMMNQIIPDHHTGKLRYTLRLWGDKGVASHKTFCAAAQGWFDHCYSFPTPIIHHLNYMCTMQHMADLMGTKIVQGVIHHGLWHNIAYLIQWANQDREKYRGILEQIEHCLDYLRPECKLGFGDRRDPTSMAQNDPECTILQFGHPCANSHHKYADMLYNLIQEI